MNLFSNVALAEAAAPATADGSGLSMILMMIVMVAVLYFVMIRPQRKKDKAVKDMLSALKVGDRICTIGGFYGTIAHINEQGNTITLKMGSLENTVVVARWAIRSVENVKTENDSQPEV